MSYKTKVGNLIKTQVTQSIDLVGSVFKYLKDLAELAKQKGSENTFTFGFLYPVLNEHNQTAGTVSGHYFHQDLLVAQKIFANNPKRHIDIGSRIDGFISHVASFREIEVLDIRKIDTSIRNISFKNFDITQKLPEQLHECCDSISSLHAIEHIGLGRYGDSINYFGYLTALENISRMLQKKGMFYLSVPIGPQRIEFNAHRVFSLKYLLSVLEQTYSIETFNYVDDVGDLHTNVELTQENILSNCSCFYGCGIFELIKR